MYKIEEKEITSDGILCHI